MCGSIISMKLFSTRFVISTILFTMLVVTIKASVECPPGPNGRKLTCAFECCPSFEGEDHGYYCCGGDDKNSLTRGFFSSQSSDQPHSDKFVMAYGNGFQIDYTLVIVGLIISVILSVLLSLLCCFLCNSCWLRRRRSGTDYNGHVQEEGFIPICCGFGIPTGTLVFSTHPPQVNPPDNIYGGSSMTSLPSSRNRVRFNNDGTPRGVLKNNQAYDY
uniref:CX domain-containing protein n=1 Tax=Strongyloides papillosus TaxID=174720 RepID=A0A0N5B687_STREA